MVSDNPAEDEKIDNFFYSVEEKYILGAACQPAKIQFCVRLPGLRSQPAFCTVTVYMYFSGAACQPAKVQLCVCLRGMHTQLALPARPACSAGQPAGQPIPPAPK